MSCLTLRVKLVFCLFKLSILIIIKTSPLRERFLLWWALMDSNQRPDRYERPALTN